jgi:hypothetical protein
MSEFDKNRVLKFVSVTLIIALAVSVGFNLYNYFVVFPQTQTDINNVRTQALMGWLVEMSTVDNLVNTAKTNYDVQQAWLTIYGEKFAGIMNSIGSSEELYTLIARATSSLNQGLEQMYFGNVTGAIWSRNLDQTELFMLNNTVSNLNALLFRESDGRTVELLLFGSFGSYPSLDPIQRLQNLGINMSYVYGHLNQLVQIGNQMVNYYY